MIKESTAMKNLAESRRPPLDTASFDEWLVTEFRPMMGSQWAGGGDWGGADGNLNVFDIFEQAGFTDLVRRRLQTMWESIPAMGDQIAPNKSVYDRTIEREIAEVASFGVAQFRARDATPAIVTRRKSLSFC
jgi:hypothetical protein